MLFTNQLNSGESIDALGEGMGLRKILDPTDPDDFLKEALFQAETEEELGKVINYVKEKTIIVLENHIVRPEDIEDPDATLDLAIQDGYFFRAIADPNITLPWHIDRKITKPPEPESVTMPVGIFHYPPQNSSIRNVDTCFARKPKIVTAIKSVLESTINPETTILLIKLLSPKKKAWQWPGAFDPIKALEVGDISNLTEAEYINLFYYLVSVQPALGTLLKKTMGKDIFVQSWSRPNRTIIFDNDNLMHCRLPKDGVEVETVNSQLFTNFFFNNK